MAKVSILVTQAKDKIESSCDLAGASIADITIMERLLRRHLIQVIEEGNKLLDKDTVGMKARTNPEFEDD